MRDHGAKLTLRGFIFVLFALSFAGSAQAQTTIRGKVVFEGTPPPTEAVEVKSDTPVCGTHKESSKIALGAGNGIANAVVRITGAEGISGPRKSVLDQVNCEFVPHVQALSVGSTLVITSSDNVLHNAHGFNEDGSTAFNIAVPIMGMEINKKLDKPGVIRLRCDAGHTWMKAYVVVVSDPFFAVTDADGRFMIEGVPPGRYELEVWQEWLGTQRQPIDVKEGAAEEVTVTLLGKN